MTDVRPRRSVLYMPGSNARALDKARSLPSDALILDLEDAVAPDAKEVARTQVADAVRAGGFGTREVLVRVNGPATPWGAADLAAAVAAAPDAILLPKVSSPADLAAASAVADAADPERRIRLWAMIETPMAILNIREIAAHAAEPGSRLAGFVLGTNDLAKETGARHVPGRLPMLPWLMTAVAAARAYGIAVVDGVYNDLDDEAGFAVECASARDMGFDGKTLIHPRQIEVANRTFTPSATEVAWAETVVAAFAVPEAAGVGALRVDGRMVERLHAEMAARTLTLMRAIAERELTASVA
ncbi:HpcH/HpaI aldolase/citrate lyase family protein [Oharaeibacter diazotrophicus]|uniref:Citrate lyase subunit beta/citryl-CoA lyase n=3 Tax=Oharaeibacter diazotrophicus TaxID=1920512 RepID=A0A4R6RF78_9HYPH|nr:CoA ester lyase [Oharaeibacter diazotrophicus]TDP84316.1 citrate lyase subunit beta/citryl-CoA lyase [Oharaeibacter diazotrophicus]BBE73353.1 (3S)-malyl-CoA thioesterase [Pleomorphomonas sp. SM30]